MGSGSVSDLFPGQGAGTKNALLPFLLTKNCLRNSFPYYLSIGMTESQYWDSDPTLAADYRKADEIRWDRRNHELWLQGMYVYEAICCCVPVLRAFSKERKPGQYPSEPYSLNNRQKKEAGRTKGTVHGYQDQEQI